MPEAIKRLYRNARSARGLREYKLDPRGLQHTLNSLSQFKDRYAGERVVLMGNGPSLKTTNWDLVRNEFTIGLNRIYLLRKEMGFYPSFYVCVKDLVIQQFASEIISLPCPKILDWISGRSLIQLDRGDLVGIPKIASKLEFHKDIINGWGTGYTVTFTAMQLAYFLGFRKVLLVGVDHNFVTSGPPRRNVVSTGEDPNHFHPDYFGKGVKWQLPDLEGSERAYRLAKVAFEDDGREIVDCTVNGHLSVFRKSALDVELSRSK